MPMLTTAAASFPNQPRPLRTPPPTSTAPSVGLKSWLRACTSLAPKVLLAVHEPREKIVQYDYDRGQDAAGIPAAQIEALLAAYVAAMPLPSLTPPPPPPPLPPSPAPPLPPLPVSEGGGLMRMCGGSTRALFGDDCCD